MPPALHVRAFTETDADAVLALWHACELTRPWNDARADIARKLLVQRELFLVGEVAGALAASVMGGYDGHRGWANYLAVHPAQQRQGFGRVLLQHLEQRLQAQGCPKLNLQLRATNAQARGFYEAIGYRQDDVISYGRRLIVDGPER